MGANDGELKKILKLKITLFYNTINPEDVKHFPLQTKKIYIFLSQKLPLVMKLEGFIIECTKRAFVKVLNCLSIIFEVTVVLRQGHGTSMG